jgi:hypothetical protein
MANFIKGCPAAQLELVANVYAVHIHASSLLCSTGNVGDRC